MFFIITLILFTIIVKKLIIDGYILYLRTVKALGKDNVIYIFKPLT